MDNVTRVAQIDNQLKALEKIISDGEYLAAGVQISVNVGPLKEDCQPDLTIELGLTANLQKIMADLRQGLLDARAYRVRCARDDMNKLQSFFAEEAGEGKIEKTGE